MREVRRLIRVTRAGLLFVVVIPFLICHSAEAGLVSYWAAEGNPNDSAGPNHGTAVGTVNYSAGQFGQAFALARTGHIDVADPVAGGLESVTGFTFAAWILLDSHSSAAPVANLRTTANRSGFTLEQTSANTLAFIVNTTGDFSTYGMGVTASGWDFDTFYHVAATFDAATHSIVLYRDGEVVASRDDLPGTDMHANSASAFQIGCNIVHSSYRWDGRIDEVRFYNTALSQSEIRQVMNPLVMQAPEIVSDSSIVIRWTSFTNHLYTLHYSTNLLSGFLVLEGNIQGTPPMNSYTDTVNGVMMKFWTVTTGE